jgi:hypothetical protein
MIRVLFEIYFIIYKFEKFISQTLEISNLNRNLFLYKYEKASKMKTALPSQAKNLFNSLLLRLSNENWRTLEEVQELSGKIYFHLATLEENNNEKLSYLKNCLGLIPQHNEAKKLYLKHSKDVLCKQ